MVRFVTEMVPNEYTNKRTRITKGKGKGRMRKWVPLLCHTNVIPCHDMEVFVMTGMSMSWQRQSVHITLLFLQKWLPDESDNWKSIAVKGLRDPIEWPNKLTRTDESRFIGSSTIRVRLVKSRRQVKHESWPPTAHNEDRKMGEWWA